MTILRLNSDRYPTTREVLRKDERGETTLISVRAQIGTTALTLQRKSETPRHRQSGDPSIVLAAKQIKIAVTIDPKQLIDLVLPTGCSNVFFELTAGEGETAIRIKGRLNPKTVRRTVATIGELGPDHVACLLQGQLLPHGKIEAAGLSAQPKARPAAAGTDDAPG